MVHSVLFHSMKQKHYSNEGGMLVINDESYFQRAEIIREKRDQQVFILQRREVNKYGWVDIGSSFLPSDIIAAYLYAQLENLELIQKQRKVLWERYRANLSELETKKDLLSYL